MPEVKLLLRGSFINFHGNNEIDSLMWFVDTSDSLTPEDGRRFLDCDGEHRNCRLVQPRKQSTGSTLLLVYCAGLALLGLLLLGCLKHLMRLSRKSGKAQESAGLLEPSTAAAGTGVQLEAGVSN